MKNINATIFRANDGYYSVNCNNEMFSGAGSTAEEAKRDMLEQMSFYKDTAIEEGFTYPNFLNEDFQIIYKFDVKTALEYYKGLLSLKGLERITGINNKQLSRYLTGKSVPRKPQVEKIEKSLHSLGDELKTISL